MIHFLVVLSWFLSLPPQLSCDGLGEGVNVVIPQDGGHGDQPRQVPGMVADGGKDDPLLTGGEFLVYISPTPVISWKLQRR